MYVQNLWVDVSMILVYNQTICFTDGHHNNRNSISKLYIKKKIKELLLDMKFERIMSLL